MSRATWIAKALRAEGLRVVEHPGWKRRGSPLFRPRGVVCHHTASRAGANAPALGLVVSGRSDLSGPLAQIVLARDGTCIVVAAGRANHAGLGAYRGLRGNSSVFGIEAENDGRGEPWTAAQIDAYPRAVAALLRRMGRDAGWCCGHREWAPNRKIDPHGIDMRWMRSAVAAILSGDAPPAATTVLGRGDSGTLVQRWQEQLVAAGEDLAVDGDFGPATEAATRRFQQRMGLRVDGLVGSSTRAAMARAGKAGRPDRAARPEPVATPSSVARPDAGPRILGRGDDGADVRAWQQRLVALGEKIAVDGDFGPATEAATKRLQARLRITADGLVGPTTRAAAERAGRPEPARPARDRDADVVLGRGDDGAAVRRWQQRLVAAGERVAVDGDFGPKTEAATRRLQKRLGVRVDGVVGPRTRAALARLARVS